MLEYTTRKTAESSLDKFQLKVTAIAERCCKLNLRRLIGVSKLACHSCHRPFCHEGFCGDPLVREACLRSDKQMAGDNENNPANDFTDCGWAAMVEIWDDQEARSLGMKGSTAG